MIWEREMKCNPSSQLGFCHYNYLNVKKKTLLSMIIALFDFEKSWKFLQKIIKTKQNYYIQNSSSIDYNNKEL